MIGLDKLGSIIKETGKAIKYLALVQHIERKRLSQSLLDICSRCEDSFQAMLKASEKIRNNFGDEKKLVASVSEFIQDDDLAAQFKPEHLCSEISNLLMDMNSNLSGLKYSVAVNKINLLQQELGRLHQFDMDMNYEYYMMRQELQELCDDYRINGKQLSAEIIKDTMNDFRDSLKGVLESVRATRLSIEQNM